MMFLGVSQRMKLKNAIHNVPFTRAVITREMIAVPLKKMLSSLKITRIYLHYLH